MKNTKLAVAFLAVVCMTALGCGKGKPPLKHMHGSVTCGGEKVPLGRVTFVPIEGTPGLPAPAEIVDGEYHFQAPGGVPLGKHRVQVVARRKTGRKVQGFNGIETSLIDEEVRMGPDIYAGEKSPLIVEIRADSDGRCDIKLPLK